VAKKELQTAPPNDGEDHDNEDAAKGDAPKQSLVQKLLGYKKLFANRRILIIAGGAFVILLAIGVGAYFLLRGSDAMKMQVAVDEHDAPPLTPPNVAFYDVPDIIVNIQTADSTPAYLKLSVSLELDSPQERLAIAVLQPRIVDQFQGYLRELRVDDLKGSAGMVRLKEELLRRINVAAAPYRVRDVLLKQMIVQ